MVVRALLPVLVVSALLPRVSCALIGTRLVRKFRLRLCECQLSTIKQIQRNNPASSAMMRSLPSSLLLPPELLTQVFLLTFPNYSPSLHSLWEQLTALSQVCRYWQEVVNSTPCLWRNVKFTGESSCEDLASCTNEVLKRSDQIPLRIWIVHNRSSEAADFEGLLPEMHRVETLSVRYDSFPSGSEALVAGVFDLPQLRRLVVETCSHWFLPLPIPFVRPSQPLPHLESLQLRGVQYGDALQFFQPTVKHLSLDLPVGCPSFPSTFDFLHVLSNMPSLQTLRISRVFFAYTPSTSPLPDVYLPHLRTLHMSDDTVACADLLDHLTFPASVLSSSDRYDFSGCVATVVPGLYHRDGRERLLGAILSKLAGIGVEGCIPTFDTLNVKTSDIPSTLAQIKLSDDDDDDGPGDQQYRPDESASSFYHRLHTTHVADTLDSFCSAAPRLMLTSIRSLSIRTVGYTDDTWPESFLRSFTSLESLYLCGTPGVFDGFAKAHRIIPSSFARPNTDRTKYATRSSTLLPLPQLRVLHLERLVFRRSNDTDGTGDFTLMLTTVLRARSEAGSPLTALSIARTSQFNEEDVDGLRAYVGAVVLNAASGLSSRM